MLLVYRDPYHKSLWAHKLKFIEIHVFIWNTCLLNWVELSWHVQNYDLIGVRIKIIANRISTKFQLWAHKLIEIGPWCPVPVVAPTGVCGVGGVAFVLDVVHSSEVPDTAGVGAGSGGGAGWQWLLGCLCMLQRLLEEHPTEFMISTPRGDASNVPLEQFTHFERIVKMLRFTMAAMSNSHQKVGRMARKCFLTCSRLQVHHLPFLQRIMQLIGELPGDQRSTLQQRLHRLAAEYNIAQHVVAGMTHCSNSFESTTDSDPPQLFSTPAMSENSTPRSVTPEPKPINVTVNNFITGNLNFMPTAPPNSPARRHMTHRKTASTSTQDDMSSDALSTSEAAPSVDESVMTECTDDCEDEASDMPTTLTVRGMPSGASATELGLPLTDDEEGDDSVLGEPLPDTSLTSEPPAQPQETLHFIPETEAAGSCSPPEGISECSGNATQASSSGPSLVEDFTDLTMSPSRPEEHISFKTEISAGSPQHFPGRSQRGENTSVSIKYVRNGHTIVLHWAFSMVLKYIVV